MQLSSESKKFAVYIITPIPGFSRAAAGIAAVFTIFADFSLFSKFLHFRPVFAFYIYHTRKNLDNWVDNYIKSLYNRDGCKGKQLIVHVYMKER